MAWLRLLEELAAARPGEPALVTERPLSAPWQGFRDALEGTGPALGQADVGAGCGDSDAGVRWEGGAVLGAGPSFPIRD